MGRELGFRALKSALGLLQLIAQVDEVCGTCPFCNKLSEILLPKPYLDMAKARKKGPGCLLAAAWNKFPKIEGVTSVVSCY